MTEKADRIKRLLEDEDLKEAFDLVRSKLLGAVASCNADEVQFMQDIKIRLTLLSAVEQNLRDAITDGTIKDFRASEQERPPFLGDIRKWRKKEV
jgi:hypothetical protein